MFRHRFDPSSAVTAVLFLSVAARYLVAGLGGPRVSYGWAVPGVLTVLGVVGLVRTVFRARRREP